MFKLIVIAMVIGLNVKPVETRTFNSGFVPLRYSN